MSVVVLMRRGKRDQMPGTGLVHLVLVDDDLEVKSLLN